MNSRQISLPDLVSEKRRNTALSLSEGFAGAKFEGSLQATSQKWCPRPGQGAPLVGQPDPGLELQKVLPTYYRTRQLALATEKGGHRMPAKLVSEMRGLEKALARELRPVHPLFFQRFDDHQLDRLLRAMPFLRLSAGRWVFGAETLGAQWPPTKDDRAFLLLQGHVALYTDATGAGERVDIHCGAVFGEKRFMLCDEGMRDHVAGAAHCEDPCIVGVLTTAALEAAYADRAFGNARIAQKWRNVPAMSKICKPEKLMESDGDFKSDLADNLLNIYCLRELCKGATAVHVRTGEEVLSSEPLEESVLVVGKGALEVRGDITLTEKLENLPPKKARIRVYIDKAQNLAGDSMFDKLDPYVICKLGDKKRFQTMVLWNAGVNPRFEFKGVLTYNNEETLDFTVMDHDKYSADDLCGNGSIPCDELYDGWSGPVQLTRPKRGLFNAEESLEEPAGKLFISVRWDYEKVSALTRTPKRKSWPDQELFILGEQECWGHEHIMMNDLFMRTLEQAAGRLPYTLTLTNIRVLGAVQKGGNTVVSCWKASKPRFERFVKTSGKQKPFVQACRASSLSKQAHIKALVSRLASKWENEEETRLMRQSLQLAAPVEETVDPSHFRIAYRGYKANVSIRNAVNLSGGGFFDELDPYAILRFRGSKHPPFRSSVLQDAGADPIWDNEATMLYNGETALEISVWDYDKYSADDLIGTGVIQVEQFCNGFEGMVPLSMPGSKKKKSLKQMMITIGIQWPTLDQNVTMSLTNAGANLTGTRTGNA